MAEGNAEIYSKEVGECLSKEHKVLEAGKGLASWCLRDRKEGRWLEGRGEVGRSQVPQP